MVHVRIVFTLVKLARRQLFAIVVPKQGYYFKVNAYVLQVTSTMVLKNVYPVIYHAQLVMDPVNLIVPLAQQPISGL